MRKVFEALQEYGVEMTAAPAEIGGVKGIKVTFAKYPRRMRFLVDEVIIHETNVDLIATIILQKLEEFVKEFKEVTE